MLLRYWRSFIFLLLILGCNNKSQKELSNAVEYRQDFQKLRVKHTIKDTPTTVTSTSRANFSGILIDQKKEDSAKVIESIQSLRSKTLSEQEKIEQQALKQKYEQELYYSIQVAALSNRQQVSDFIKEHGIESYKPFIIPAKVNNNVTYRVRIGKFKTAGEAQDYARKLKEEKKIATFVISNKN